MLRLATLPVFLLLALGPAFAGARTYCGAFRICANDKCCRHQPLLGIINSSECLAVLLRATDKKRAEGLRLPWNYIQQVADTLHGVSNGGCNRDHLLKQARTGGRESPEIEARRGLQLVDPPKEETAAEKPVWPLVAALRTAVDAPVEGGQTSTSTNRAETQARVQDSAKRRGRSLGALRISRPCSTSKKHTGADPRTRRNVAEEEEIASPIGAAASSIERTGGRESGIHPSELTRGEVGTASIIEFGFRETSPWVFRAEVKSGEGTELEAVQGWRFGDTVRRPIICGGRSVCAWCEVRASCGRWTVVQGRSRERGWVWGWGAGSGDGEWKEEEKERIRIRKGKEKWKGKRKEGGFASWVEEVRRRPAHAGTAPRRATHDGGCAAGGTASGAGKGGGERRGERRATRVTVRRGAGMGGVTGGYGAATHMEEERREGRGRGKWIKRSRRDTRSRLGLTESERALRTQDSCGRGDLRSVGEPASKDGGGKGRDGTWAARQRVSTSGVQLLQQTSRRWWKWNGRERG
ncbi:hypothetical protein C8R47DRAFT_1280475 [Mycena vitilis]|nr:hypothetical protein C8R47DRAFT_1280475 [Mycena vitilis]